MEKSIIEEKFPDLFQGEYDLSGTDKIVLRYLIFHMDLIDANYDLFAVLKDGCFEYARPQVLKLFEYPPEDFIGLNILDIVDEERSKDTEKKLEIVSSGLPSAMWSDFKRSNGTYIRSLYCRFFPSKESGRIFLFFYDGNIREIEMKNEIFGITKKADEEMIDKEYEILYSLIYAAQKLVAEDSRSGEILACSLSYQLDKFSDILYKELGVDLPQ